MEQASSAKGKKRNRGEPLAFAYFALVLFMIIYFARPEDWIPGLSALPLAKIAGVLMLAAVALSFGTIRWQFPWEIILLCLLVLYLWLTVPFSTVYRGGAFNVMLDFSKVLPFVIAIYGAVRSIVRLRWIMFVQAGSVAGIAIASIIHAHTSSGRLQGVLAGMYGNPNDLALAIDLSLPLCLAFALMARSYWEKLAWAGAMLTMVYAVLLAASRAGALALAIVTCACLWQLGVKGRRFYLLLLIPLAGIVLWLYGGNALRERFVGQNTGSSEDHNFSLAEGSTRQRQELLIRSLQVTAEHPLFGVGPGNFAIVSGVWHVSHNSYTQVSSEGGIPAFLLYLLILWRGIANLRDVRKHHKSGKQVRMLSMALNASLLAFLVGSFFASVAYLLFPYCLIAYTGTLRLIARKESVVRSRIPERNIVQVDIPATL